jgi:hypothetical protein
MKMTVALVVLVLSFGRLAAQTPIEIVPPKDTAAAGFAAALKQAVLSSSSFVLTTSGPRLRVRTVIGGATSVTCGDSSAVVRGVALYMTDALGNHPAVLASLFRVGEEQETAQHQLVTFYEIATSMRIPERR